mmetsp:Transcript_1008/g.1542  ORF Transcript_1008/g.1542 Transcript_1008/m.1542 type:complete len:249 (+) Transcript_1008:962-1708(+)
MLHICCCCCTIIMIIGYRSQQLSFSCSTSRSMMMMLMICSCSICFVGSGSRSLRRILQSWQKSLHRTTAAFTIHTRSIIATTRFRNEHTLLLLLLTSTGRSTASARRSMHAQWQRPSSHSPHYCSATTGGGRCAGISRVRIWHVPGSCALILAHVRRICIHSIACYADTDILIIGSSSSSSRGCAACACSRSAASTTTTTAGVFVHVSLAEIPFCHRGLTIRAVAEFDSRASTGGVAADQFCSMFHVF